MHAFNLRESLTTMKVKVFLLSFIAQLKLWIVHIEWKENLLFQIPSWYRYLRPLLLKKKLEKINNIEIRARVS